uniref:Uncharacterized protein n=1 Tax=Catagonus wagneri TaxID=51154 RepID=A0A8C3WLK3_9CETA
IPALTQWEFPSWLKVNLFIAVVLISADQSGKENIDSVEALQETLIHALRTLIMKNPPNEASELLAFKPPPKEFLCLNMNWFILNVHVMLKCLCTCVYHPWRRRDL